MIDIREVWAIEDDPENFLYDMFEYLEDKCRGGAQLEALSAPERILFLTLHTQYDVEQFGFCHVLAFSPCDPEQALAEAFMSIGAHKAAAVCRQAARICGETCPVQSPLQAARMAQSETPDILRRLADCDKAFCTCGDDLSALNFAYVRRHAAAFGKPSVP